MTTQAADRVVAYSLQPRQADAMDAIWQDECNQVLYGGAAGGAKSHFLRALAFHLSRVWPGGRIAIFRDNYTQLQKTQVAAWFTEMERLGFPVRRHWHSTTAEWHFVVPHPYEEGQFLTTIVEFLHLAQDIGAEKWLSAEWAALLVDEATQLPQEDLELLFSRVRANELQQSLWRRMADEREQAARDAGVTDENEIRRIRSDWRSLAVFATNPGGESHSYFKEKFVDVAAEHDGKAWEVVEKMVLPGLGEVELVLRKKFVPSFLSDNKHLNAIQYAATLAPLGERRRAQLLSGDWNYFEGKVFHMLDKDIHLVDAKQVFGGRLAPPRAWPRGGGLDHGTQNPTAAEWMTRDEDGFFIVGYLEYYSAGPNKQHIDAIRALLTLDGEQDMPFEADPRMFHKTKGHDRLWSVADEFMHAGEPPEDPTQARLARTRGIRLVSSRADRIPSRMALERLFEPDADRMFPEWHPKAGLMGAPRAFICKQAPNLWRELNNIRYVDGESEETVKEDDHAYDAAYRIMVVFELSVSRRSRYQPAATVGYAQPARR